MPPVRVCRDLFLVLRITEKQTPDPFQQYLEEAFDDRQKKGLGI